VQALAIADRNLEDAVIADDPQCFAGTVEQHTAAVALAEVVLDVSAHVAATLASRCGE
jgi:hypothetical protein